MSSYNVTFMRDEDGWWVATVRGVKGCHTQGRTINEAERRIREALGLFVEDADEAALVRNVKLPDNVKKVVGLHRKYGKQFVDVKEKFKDATVQAVKVLTGEFGLSVRDAGELLGLSHQRVQQIQKG